MALPPTVTVRIREALKYGQQRAEQQNRTQQLELGDNLFVRIAPGGRRFLLFQLEGEPDLSTARAVAEALGLTDPEYGWHQGATLRSLTAREPGSGPDLYPDAGPASPESASPEPASREPGEPEPGGGMPR